MSKPESNRTPWAKHTRELRQEFGIGPTRIAKLLGVTTAQVEMFNIDPARLKNKKKADALTIFYGTLFQLRVFCEGNR